MLPRAPARRGSSIVALSLLALVAVASRDAGAVPLGYHATLSVEFGLIIAPPFQTATISGSGFAQVAPNGSFTLAAGDIAGTTTVPTANTVVSALILSASVPGGTLAVAGGTLPLQGSLRVCAFASCNFLDIPLSPFGSGLTQVMDIPGIGNNQTVWGSPWGLTATIMNTFISFQGFAHGPASATSTAVATGGTLQLVSAMLIQPGSGLGGGTPYVGVARLTFEFVPEPATALLLVAGITVLAARGAGRRA
jgi:hypothetical protein